MLVKEDHGKFIQVECQCKRRHTIFYDKFRRTDHGIEFNSPVLCPCGEKGVSVKHKTRNTNHNINQRVIKYAVTSILVLGLTVFGVVKGVAFLSTIKFTDTDHKDFKDITPEEYNDFMKWDAKQQQKKRDESPMFKDE